MTDFVQLAPADPMPRLIEGARLGNLTSAETVELIRLLERRERLASRRRFFGYFPESGPLSRHAYVKHMAFFEAGNVYDERAFMAANRIGKTESGAYEATCHATGLYPEWWKGKRFKKPTHGWACGDTGQSVKEILQAKLLGEPGVPSLQGTGMIPAELILGVTKKRGIADAIENVYVRHVSGGISVITFKSYDQKRISFQGTAQDWIWLDEEPPEDIYSECQVRTMTTKGMIFLTFTPLMGMSKVVLEFLPGGRLPEPGAKVVKFIIQATWDDAPHLSPEDRERMWAKLPPHQRDARAKGLPSLGAGAIYPVEEDRITVEDFIIPPHWPRAFAMDVGWNWTSALWGALDRESGVAYWYSVYKQGEAVPAVHAHAIKGRGSWIPGVIDPAANGRNQKDGEKLISIYRDDERLDLVNADNAVESGIYNVWQAKVGGKIKVFKGLAEYWGEHRIYRRDEKGKIVKVNDHVMDCERYLYASIFDRAITKPLPLNPREIVGGGRGPSAMCS